MGYCTVMGSTVQYGTVQYGTFSLSAAVIRYSTVHYSTVQYSTVQYSTVQYITVQYSKRRPYWPAPPSIHRGLEWPQLLNRLFDCSLLVCLEANFLIFLLLTSSFIVRSPSKRQRESHKSETLKEVNEASPNNNDRLPYPKTETRVTRASALSWLSLSPIPIPSRQRIPRPCLLPRPRPLPRLRPLTPTNTYINTYTYSHTYTHSHTQ